MDERDLLYIRRLIYRLAEAIVKARKSNREEKKENVENNKNGKTIPL